MAEISSSLEDYIEAVYSIYTKDNKVKAIDVARRLNVSRASVTEALQKLEQFGLINYGHYGTISVTEEGVKKAKEVIKNMKLSQNFLKIFSGLNTALQKKLPAKLSMLLITEF